MFSHAWSVEMNEIPTPLLIIDWIGGNVNTILTDSLILFEAYRECKLFVPTKLSTRLALFSKSPQK